MITKNIDQAALEQSIREQNLAVYVRTFGCQQNEADSERLLGIALAMGYTKTDEPEKADLILVNTCAIREHAEKKALSIVGQYKHIKEKNPRLVIGVCGCMPAQPHRAEEIKHHLPYVSFTLAPGKPEELRPLILKALAGQKRQFIFDEEKPAICEGLPVERNEKHKAWVSVMYGCNNFCSYCIVPYVRGRERSRASEAVIAEVKGLIADGVKEITLLGQNVNSYKSDIDFATLLERLACLDGDFLLRFMTSHPKDVPDALIEVMAKYPQKIAPHFHLPLQSGSDAILKEMNRHYDKEKYLLTVKKLRQAMPHISLSTDIIVGFPGETEEDFLETMNVLESVRFDLVYSFIYSPRKGTVAAKKENKVSANDKKDRMQRLLALQATISKEIHLTYENKTVCVLVDGEAKNGKGMLSGRTAQNKLVHFEGTPDLIGNYVNVHITRADAFALIGTQTKG